MLRYSEIVEVGKMVEHEFCFKWGRRAGFDGGVRAYVRYHNGIEDVEMGYFEFSIKWYLEGGEEKENKGRGGEKIEEDVWKRTGVYAGKVVFSVEVGKAENMGM